MHLFGDTSTPHLWHVHVFHEGSQVTLDWEVRNAPQLHWRVLRSAQGYASGPETPGGNGQSLVGETTDTHIVDPCDHSAAYYTLFSRNQTGGWQRQIETKVRANERLHWFHPDAQEVLAAHIDFLRSPTAGAGPQQNPILYGASHLTPMPAEDIAGDMNDGLEEWVRIEGVD